jgi:regulator of replication initiation timing
MDPKVREAEMNNYHSSNFATVFFLVIVFIGTGLLMYHTYDVSLENGRLKDTVGTLQASVEKLNVENTGLKAENTILKTKNASLTVEKSKLQIELEKALAEITSLKAADTGKLLVDLVKLRRENNELRLEIQRLEAMRNTDGSQNNMAPEVLLSTFLPVDPEFWKKVLAVALVEVFLLMNCLIYNLVKNLWRGKVVIPRRNNSENGSTRKSRITHVIDTHFVDR